MFYYLILSCLILENNFLFQCQKSLIIQFKSQILLFISKIILREDRLFFVSKILYLYGIRNKDQTKFHLLLFIHFEYRIKGLHGFHDFKKSKNLIKFYNISRILS